MYDEYSALYEFATKALADKERTDPKLRKFLASQSVLAGQMTCFALLITPIQRVPRYLLLLKEILKATPNVFLLSFCALRCAPPKKILTLFLKQELPDFEPLGRAIKIVQDAAVHINEHIREREVCFFHFALEPLRKYTLTCSDDLRWGCGGGGQNLMTLRVLDIDFPNMGIADRPDRVLVHRGNLLKKSRKKDQPYHFLLFSDMLIYQKQIKTADIKPPRKLEFTEKVYIYMEKSERANPLLFQGRREISCRRQRVGV